MTMSEYQLAVVATAKSPALNGASGADKRSVVLLGLSGEVGELLGEYKKRLRDKDDHKHFATRVKEKLGDVLWYVAATSHYFNLDLDVVATDNVEKTNDRWGLDTSSPHELPPIAALDQRFPQEERLPRQVEIEVREITVNGIGTVQLYLGDEQLGSDITDRSLSADGYRYHDVLHLAFLAVLGWSPVMRNLINKRRISDHDSDLNEDGGRAIAIEEGITAMVFAYAQDRDHLASANMIDYELLHMIRVMTRHLEVSRSSLREWQVALLQGFEAWRSLEATKGGRIRLDLDARTLKVIGDEEGTWSLR